MQSGVWFSFIKMDKELTQKTVDHAFELVIDLIGTRLTDLHDRPDEERNEDVYEEEKLLKVALFVLCQNPSVTLPGVLA